MKRLILREYRKSKNDLLIQLVTSAVLPVLIALVFIVFKDSFSEREILGMKGSSLSAQILFTSPVIFWMMFEAAFSAGDIFSRDERDNSIYIFLDQWYNKTQICVSKMIWVALRTAVPVFCITIINGIVALLADNLVGSELHPDVFFCYFISSVVISTLISAGSMYMGILGWRYKVIPVMLPVMAVSLVLALWMPGYPFLYALIIFIAGGILIFDLCRLSLNKYTG